MLWPKLSVIVPSFNQGDYLEHTLRSIQSQEYPNLEVIVLDGGSEDGSVEVIKLFESMISYWRSAPDDGQSAAIVEGMNLATGDFVSWLNSDDMYASGALRSIGEFFAHNPDSKWVYGDTRIVDSQGKLVAEKRSVRFLPGVFKYVFLTVPQMSSFWSKTLYEESGGIDSGLKFAMDYDLFARMSELHRPRRIDKEIGVFRIHSESKTSTLDDVRKREQDVIAERICRIKPSSPWIHPTRLWYRLVLIALFAENGSLWPRLRTRLSNRFRSVSK